MAQYDVILSQENATGSFNEARLASNSAGKFFTFDSNGLPISKIIAISEVDTLNTALGNKVETSLLGANSGVATLDASGKIVATQLPASIVGAVQYQGVWNASTNTPTMAAAAAANMGYYFKVSVAGTTNVDGQADWQPGDWIISDGTTWDKVDNSELVTAVAGKIGNVTLVKSDVGLTNVTDDAQLKIASNLSDLANATTARTNLGLGNVATLNIGVSAGTVTAGDDSRLPVLDEKAALVGTSGTASATNKYVTNSDTRLTDLRGINFVAAPASATATGTVGQVAYDNNYFYTCVASNTWKRNAVASWS